MLRYEKRFLAGKVGCSQENLRRAFAALRRIGVETLHGSVVVHDVAALHAFARPPEPQRTSGRKAGAPSGGRRRPRAPDESPTPSVAWS